MSPSVVDAHSLVKEFGSTRAVNGVSFSVGAGEVFGFFGPNGAGKTTTMRMLAGLTAPTSGEATVCGVDVRRDPTEVRRHISMVQEEAAFYEKMTPDAYLTFFARMAGLTGSEAERKGREAAEVAESREFARKRIADLSHGQRQRVSIARALLSEGRAKVMFLDEPFQGIDIIHRKSLREHLRAYAARGNTLFFTSHNLIEAEAFVDRFAFIDKGEILMSGTARELRERYLVPSFALRVSDVARAAKALAQGVGIKECVVKGEEVHLTLLDPADVPKISAVLGGASVALLEMRQLGTMEEVFLRARQGKR